MKNKSLHCCVAPPWSTESNLHEALQKAMRSIDKRGAVFHWDGPAPDAAATAALVERAAVPAEHRLLDVQQAIRGGAGVEELFASTRIDP